MFQSLGGIGIVQFDQGQLQCVARRNNRQRLAIAGHEASAQDFMAINNRLQGTTKCGFIEKTRQAQREWAVISGRPGLQLFEKPEPLLREG